MIERQLFYQLDQVAFRYRQLVFWRSLAVVWLLTALIGALVWGLAALAGWNPQFGAVALCAVALVACILCFWAARVSARNYLWLARRVEAAHPELRTCLLAAIEQRREMPWGRLGYLQESVVRQALAHAKEHPWEDVVPTRRILSAVAVNFATLALLLVVLVALALSPARLPAAGDKSIVDAQAIAGQKLTLTVEPGNTEVERGAGLLVLARFQGPQPAEATLVCKESSGEVTRIAMSKSLDDPVFGARIPAVAQPLNYHVEVADHNSDSYQVTVFEYPKLVRGDANLKYPTYTSLPEKLVQDVRTISAVEGTELTLICNLNKAVASATLTEKGAESIPLVATKSDAAVYQATLRCEKSRRLQLQLVDQQGRTNVKLAEFVINVVPNRPPDLKLAFPARDVEVSPLEETDVKANVYDDFGLKRFGLAYAIAGAEPADIVLGKDAAGKERLQVAHVIRFEELKAEPDQLLSYHFWAEDIGPDGKERRTQSDMYFAEVRHFEEIFRQGEQPPGGQSQQQQQQQGGQNAQAAQKLAELQKEIINATWKLIRRETSSKPTEPFAADALLIYQSQASALEQAQALAEKLKDPQSQAHAAAVARSMTDAWHRLEEAKDGPALAPLQPALAAEQAAYQALLKLRAREHRVIRGQRQSSSASSSSSSSRSQQQLQQLELKNEENRYETQRTAQSQQQEQQDRETRQVLNRLSELARRQSDLNERLKELQAALEEAKTQEEREEVRQQLKRLRDEQQQILRDTDELKARMETPENQERMAEAREQLEQTRDQIRKAAESLEQEKVSRAAAEGTRVERDFQELRNEFRRQASNRFSEEMRQMRDDARQLDEKENELSQRLAGDDKPAEASKESKGKAGANSKSLRDTQDREKISAELDEQQQRLKDLLERMRQTVQEAEQTEPLLSQQLYDTARKAQEQSPDRALEAAELSMRRGLLDDAREQERIARQGIGELREGVERASESVLGDETEALRRAREELQRLADELNNEIAQNSPRGNRPGNEDQAQPGQSEPGNGKPGGGKTGEEQQPGDGKQGGKQEAGGKGKAGEQSKQSGEDGAKGDQQPGGQKSDKGGQYGEGSQKGQGGKGGKPGDGDPADAQAQASGQQAKGGEGKAGQGKSGEGKAGEQQGKSGESKAGQPGSQQSARGGPGGRDGARRLRGFDETEGGGNTPLTGEDFLNWSDRLRDVEEMVDDPQLRAEASRIRDRARSIRAEFKRHSAPPNWDVVLDEVSKPLVELRDRVAEELIRRTAKDAIVPLDRDPVPPKYSEKTRLYYERLGSGK